MNTCVKPSTLFLVISLLLLTACEQSLSSLPAAKRPIPAQLPVEQRQALRKLPFEHAHNFRDLGGYINNDGRSVKWGLIYRSDELSDLSSEDEYYLDQLGLTRIVDFRSIKEREAKPDRISPASSIAMQHRPINISATDIDLMKANILSGELDQEQLSNLLVSANREFIEHYTPTYKAWMQSILESNALPMVFHCTAGKDRTGLAAALLLLALDIPKATVMTDYLATNQYTAEQINKTITLIKWGSLFQTDAEALRPILSVEARFINEAFRVIEEHYGSIEGYLEKGLGLTAEKRAHLKALLLEG